MSTVPGNNSTESRMSLGSALNVTGTVCMGAWWRACPPRLPKCWLGKLVGQAPSSLLQPI